MKTTLSRRKFVKTTTALVAGIAASPQISPADALPDKKMIGLQVGSVSFVDEGPEKVLDLLQERAAVNTIFLTTFTYGRGLAG